MKSSDHKVQRARQYCNVFKVEKNVYVIGVYRRPITIYKQQVRALNLFYSLYRTRDDLRKPDASIFIVGAGIAGLTIAAAALKAGIGVHLFEKREDLIPLQRKCSKRYIHPHSYDWPDEGSLVPDAGLPIMNWHAGTAKEVVNQLIEEFKQITADSASNDLYHPYLNTEISGIKIMNFHPGNSWITVELGREIKKDDIKTIEKYQEFRCQIVVLATGFGVEKSINDVDGQNTPSYWSDTDYDQPQKTHSRPYFISGTGDGGFAELFTATIEKGGYEDIHKLIESERGTNLKSRLAAIKKEYHSSKNKSSRFLYDKFSRIPDSLYKSIEDGLIKRNTIVFFTGSGKDFPSLLNLDKISMMNAFIGFILAKKGFINYSCIILKKELSTKKWLLPDTLKFNWEDLFPIFRHGFDPLIDLKGLSNYSEIIGNSNFKAKQERSTIYTDIPIWSNDEFLQILAKKEKSIRENSSDAYSLMMFYASTIIKLLNHFTTNKANVSHRVTLHKYTLDNEQMLYQQVIPFLTSDGTLINIDNQDFTKRQKITTGSIGYSMQTGKPSLIFNDENNADFHKLLRIMELDESKDRYKLTKVFLALPLMTEVSYFNNEIHGHVSGKSVNLALYIDSNNNSPFKNLKLANLIIEISASFIDSLNTAFEQKLIRNDELRFNPMIVHENHLTRQIEDFSAFSQGEFIQTLINKCANLKLKTFYTFSQSN